MHSCFIHVATRYLVCQCVRIRQLYIDHTLRYDMAQLADLKKPTQHQPILGTSINRAATKVAEVGGNSRNGSNRRAWH